MYLKCSFVRLLLLLTLLTLSLLVVGALFILSTASAAAVLQS